jgi:hypothetical protein
VIKLLTVQGCSGVAVLRKALEPHRPDTKGFYRVIDASD